MIAFQPLLRGATALLLAAALLPAYADDTLQRVRASQTLTFGFVPGDAPFSAGTAEQPAGYAIELCNLLAAQLRQDLGLPAVGAAQALAPEPAPAPAQETALVE